MKEDFVWYENRGILKEKWENLLLPSKNKAKIGLYKRKFIEDVQKILQN